MAGHQLSGPETFGLEREGTCRPDFVAREVIQGGRRILFLGIPIGGSDSSGFGYWFQNKPVCKNWWYNEIGIPKVLGPVFLLMKEQLSPQEKQAAVEVMEKARFGMTGQNKVWLAAMS